MGGGCYGAFPVGGYYGMDSPLSTIMGCGRLGRAGRGCPGAPLGAWPRRASGEDASAGAHQVQGQKRGGGRGRQPRVGFTGILGGVPRMVRLLPSGACRLLLAPRASSVAFLVGERKKSKTNKQQQQQPPKHNTTTKKKKKKPNQPTKKPQKPSPSN